ncbi:hypothetical protein DLREEDagrD3_12910 [Denitratisoma sp. agr-D3]
MPGRKHRLLKADPVVPAVPAAPTAPPPVWGGGFWAEALAQITDQAEEAPAAAKVALRLFWQLAPNEDGEFRLTCFKGVPGPNGRFSGGLKSWNNFVPALTKPPRFVDEDDLFALRLLLAQDKQARSRNSLAVVGRHTGEVLTRLAETGRLYGGFTPLVPLVQGESRPARIGWRKDEQNFFHPVVETTPPIQWVIPATPPMYVDGNLGELGTLAFDLPAATAARILASPALSESEAQLTALVLEEASPGAPLPAVAPVREVGGSPRAVLHLNTARIPLIYALRDYPSNSWNVELDYGQVYFHYGSGDLVATVPAREDQNFVRLGNGETVRVQRQPEVEAAWLDGLARAGFAPLDAEQMQLPPHGGFDPKISYILADEDAWSGFMAEQLPQLREAGWDVRIPPDFRHHAYQVESWEVDISEEEPGWFNLDMGIIVDGQRLPLAPLLASLFERDERWLEVARIDNIRNNEIIDLMTPQGYRVRVPAGRIKPLAKTLIDLFDGIIHQGERLRLSRLDAPRLAKLDDGQWNTSGLSAVQQALKELEGMAGVPPVAAPKGFALTLRPYQEEGLAWLQYLRQHNLAGILADDMGLGKTAQALAHLLLEKEQGRLGARREDDKIAAGPRPALVVVPTSLVFNWKTEAERFAPQLSLLFLHGKERKENFAEISRHDVVLTTYPLLWRDAEELSRHDFHLLILDEAQTVKNSASKGAAVIRQLKARHRLCLTGTPLENHLGELWSQFDFLLPGFLGDKRHFNRVWRTPIEKHGNLLRRDLLAGRIRPFVLRRRKEDVATELPSKSVILRTVELEAGQRDLYETVRSIMDVRIRQEIAARGFARSQIVILDALLKLRQVCCDPRLVKSAAAHRVKERAKLDLLMTMLPELVEEGRRILVFSQFTSMLALIETELKALGLEYELLTGETRDRETPIRNFQEGKVPIFLISLKAGGVGLNLTAADTVIHYDPWWNPAVENQATDRAHRIGQTKAVFVYKLVVAGSIEEKILAMQEQKAALAANILSDDKGGGVKFSEADLTALLAPLPPND